MNTQSILRHLLCDKESLSQYYAGEPVEFEDVKRRMLGLERGEDRYLPDHHYRLLSSKTFNGIRNIAGVFTDGIHELTIDLLDIKLNQILIKPAGQHIWQDLITGMPPLLLQCAYLWKVYKVDWSKPSEIQAFYADVILPNFRYTALPSPDAGSLSEFCRKNGGFNDLHMHLNGATEVDVVWQDYLTFPDKIYYELSEVWGVEKVRELLEQESTLFTPLKFRNLLTVARRLRALLFRLTDPSGSAGVRYSLKGLINRLTDRYSVMPGDNSQHPFAVLTIDQNNGKNRMAIEALMYVRVMDYISKNPENGTAELFHFYLLILGLCNRLLVQQMHQNGFEQFQKLTLSGLREYTERKYSDRFHQIRGNKLQYLSFLEGRFSPKATEKELTEMLNLVVSGWNSMANADKKRGVETPDMKLVAHFIKKAEGKGRDDVIRHRSLRIDLWKRAAVLSLLISKYKKYGNLVTGVDAASSEFDAPPEVFAPIFRVLRRSFIHFTYHAGEDFHHLVSGIRAIYEVMTFTDMQFGDRIGHAVAVGLSPSQWLKAIGKQLLMARGEWLDNLIFVYHLSKLDEGIALDSLKEKLILAIKKHAGDVYQMDYSLDSLEEAWCYRKYEPMLVFAKDREQASYREVFDEKHWLEIKRLKIGVETKEIMKRYHNAKFRKHYEEIITVKSNAIFGAGGMFLCQRIVLKIMQQRNIVIETLPTSNIRIGHHRSFRTYHLWNWLKWHEQDNDIPAIVIGTDDTGIFATNIFNEYANIYHHLTGPGKKSRILALDTIKMLEKNSEQWRFGSGL